MTTLRPYQVEMLDLALASLEAHGGFALLAEQRTGKTSPACAIVQRLGPRRILITCPEVAVQVWNAHIDEYGLITLERSDDDIRIVTRDSIWGQRKKLKRWLVGDDRSMVIADEGHDFKGKNSKRSRALRILGRGARFRLLLTGTPQESGLEDYWAQFDFVDDELFGPWKFFKARYLVYGGFRNKKIVGYQREDELRELIASRSYRVLLEDVKPVKTDIAPFHEVRFDLVKSRPKYDEMEQGFMLELNKVINVKEIGTDGVARFVRRRKRVVAPRAITQAMKLHQLSGGFILDPSGNVHHFGDEKLAQCGALLLHLKDVPVVVFVRFVFELYRVARLGAKLGRQVTLVSGKHKGYVSGTPFDLIVIQIDSATSIDLAHAEEAVFFSWGYSYLKFDQAKFRIRSYTSLRARYHFLIANNTVDEQLYQAVTTKQSFARLILDKWRDR